MLQGAEEADWASRETIKEKQERPKKEAYWEKLAAELDRPLAERPVLTINILWAKKPTLIKKMRRYFQAETSSSNQQSTGIM